MKVESKHIVPFIDTVRMLLADFKEGLRECEDTEQIEQVFDYTHDQIKTVIVTFKVDHLTPIEKKDTDTRPSFVKKSDLLVDKLDMEMDSNEETVNYMTRLYRAIKIKLKSDGVDHLLKKERIYHHIENYLVGSDPDWNYYFKTDLANATYKVIDTIVDEIMEHRRKYPQLELVLSPANTPKATNYLTSLLND